MEYMEYNSIYDFFRNYVGGIAKQFELTTYKNNYPPINILINDDDGFTIEIAVAGFDKSELKIIDNPGTPRILSISGEKKDKSLESRSYGVRRIAYRPFCVQLPLQEFHTIKYDSVKLENGILTIIIVKNIPETLKPQEVNIN